MNVHCRLNEWKNPFKNLIILFRGRRKYEIAETLSYAQKKHFPTVLKLKSGNGENVSIAENVSKK